MARYRYLLKHIENLPFEEARTYIKEDETFLNGLQIEEKQIHLYIMFGDEKITYFLYWKKELLFHGDTFKISPLYDWDSIECMISLLSAFLLQGKDVEANYFKNYTQKQLDFRDQDNGDLINCINDVLNKTNEVHYQLALKYFQSFLIDTL